MRIDISSVVIRSNDYKERIFLGLSFCSGKKGGNDVSLVCLVLSWNVEERLSSCLFFGCLTADVSLVSLHVDCVV